MKKIALFCFMLTLCSFASNAQRSVSIRPICGLSYNTINWDNARIKRKGLDYHTGYDLGILGDLKISSHWIVETGFIYSHKKSNIGRGLKPDRITFNFGLIENTTYHLLNIPLNIVFKQSSNSPLYAGAGIIASYNLNSKRTADDMESPDERKYEDEFSLKTMHGSPFNTSGSLFVGKDWKVNKANLGIRLQYTVQFTNWDYPTHYDDEDKVGYPMRFNAFSLNLTGAF